MFLFQSFCPHPISRDSDIFPPHFLIPKRIFFFQLLFYSSSYGGTHHLLPPTLLTPQPPYNKTSPKQTQPQIPDCDVLSKTKITGREPRSDPENSFKDDLSGREDGEDSEAREERRHEGPDAYESFFCSLCLYISTNGLCLLRLDPCHPPQSHMVV